MCPIVAVPVIGQLKPLSFFPVHRRRNVTVSEIRGRSPHLVLVHGLPYFAKMLAGLLSGEGWDVRFHPANGVANILALARDLRRCDLAYKIGGRIALGKFNRTAKFFGKKKIVMHWVGSDVLHAQRDLSANKQDPWVMRTMRHWADAPWLAEEVRRLGLECEFVPIVSVRIPLKPSPLPEEFSVLVYLPDIRKAEFYGLGMILEVARRLPHICFQLVGISKEQISRAPSNLRILGWVPDLTSIFEQVSVLWRPVRHDSVSFMVQEGLGHGRHVLWSYEFPGCVRVSDANQAQRELERLYELHRQNRLQLNHDGLQVIAEKYHPQQVKEEIIQRFREIIMQS